ncbi:MAG: hypothetical protein K9H61_09700 [Bacteroidia bacterium]|nr:hypothetical protein [Bacteroidia bacterium]MCF8425151.1 hypothetical protein [Bacteroidia bacterium]MCF8447255.1 hypothetical protein [Bacteroidia bacterium]
MNTNINFNELWAKQTSPPPNTENLLVQVKKLKKANLRKLLLTNILLLATSIFIILIWVKYQPQFISTKIGIILIILAMTIFLFVYNKSYSLFKNGKNWQSNKDYLKDLLAIKAKQQFMQSTLLNLYFILLSTGLALYMYEYTSRMKPLIGILAYVITALWILFNWFYIRPKQINKQQSEVNNLINKFEAITKQLE